MRDFASGVSPESQGKAKTPPCEQGLCTGLEKY